MNILMYKDQVIYIYISVYYMYLRAHTDLKNKNDIKL